jgi:hypothetical protein
VKHLQCDDPKFKVCIREQIKIYGSNEPNVLGLLLFCTNKDCDRKTKEFTIPSFDTHDKTKTGDLCLYGSIPFRYITLVSPKTFDLTLLLYVYE